MVDVCAMCGTGITSATRAAHMFVCPAIDEPSVDEHAARYDATTAKAARRMLKATEAGKGVRLSHSELSNIMECFMGTAAEEFISDFDRK